MTSAPPSAPLAGTARILGWLTGTSFLACVLGFALGRDYIGGIGLLGTVSALLTLWLLPAGVAIGVGLHAPAAVPDRVRVGAAVAGITGLLDGWGVYHAATAPAVPVGVAIMALSVLAMTPLLRAPRPASWRPPRFMLSAAILLFVAMVVIPKFEGTKEHAYWLEMRGAVEEVAAWQDAVHADSGHYATALDTTQLATVARFLYHQGAMDLVASGDRYAVTTKSTLTVGRCAAFVGGDAVAPAMVPGQAACTPFPHRMASDVGILWLAVLVVTSAVAFLFPPGRSTA